MVISSLETQDSFEYRSNSALAHGLWFVNLWKPKTYPETICVTFERQRKEFIKHQIRINVKSRTISSYWAILVNPYCYCQVLKHGIKHSDKFQPISSFAIIAITWSHTSHELRVATTNRQTPDFSCSSQTSVWATHSVVINNIHKISERRKLFRCQEKVRKLRILSIRLLVYPRPSKFILRSSKISVLKSTNCMTYHFNDS